MKIKKIVLITGHKGFIASNFIHYLKKKNIDFEIFKKNLLKKKCSKKYSHLFHFAFKKNLGNMKVEKFFEQNVIFTKKLARFAKKNKIQLIFPSTPTYFPSKEKHKESDLLYSYNLYSFSKILCEKVIKKEKNLDYLILRIFNVYGEGGHSFLEKLKSKLENNHMFTFKENDWVKRDFIFLQDLFQIFEKLINKKIINRSLNIGSGKSYSLKQIANKIDNKKLINFSNDVHFTPNRPVVKSDISKLVKLIKFAPKTKIYDYFN